MKPSTSKQTRLLIYGKNSIKERLRVNPQSIVCIYLQDNFSDQEIADLIKKNHIPFEVKNEFAMRRTKRADRLQGVIAQIKPIDYLPLSDLFLTKTNLLFLDGLNDPQNIGSIMRIAACFGNFSLVLPEKGSCDINETVLHVASGAENFVKVSQVKDLKNAILDAKARGYKIFGTSVENGKSLDEVEFAKPIGLILGSEGKGMSHELLPATDENLSIPMKGEKLSLNVAMAASIFCYQISKF